MISFYDRILIVRLQGVIEIEILRAIERLSGCAIPELFDWIVGTSIGGILTLGMVYGELYSICIFWKIEIPVVFSAASYYYRS